VDFIVINVPTKPEPSDPPSPFDAVVLETWARTLLAQRDALDAFITETDRLRAAQAEEESLEV
jgi:hypothetical protein